MNWSLPKTLAEFSGDPARDRAMVARHPQWWVSARAKCVGPVLTLRAALRVFQIGRDGHENWARMSGRLRARPALVRVTTSGTPQLTDWLRSGHFPGLIVERFDAELEPARAA